VTPNSSPIFHSRAFAGLANFYEDTVTIQDGGTALNTEGEEIPVWVDVVGLTSLPCSIAAVSGREVKRQDGTISESPWRIAIAGIYTTITTKRRAVVSGANYDILVVQHDSHHNMTSLDCEIVT
jgi:head-tail adaptor